MTSTRAMAHLQNISQAFAMPGLHGAQNSRESVGSSSGLSHDGSMSGALSHLRVLDLSRVLAGPWASQALADLGAEVIKVERPGSGDDTRGWGPPWLGEESAYFVSTNRGKKSITIDLSNTEGQELVR